MNKNKKQSAFTIVELLIVIVIIGILAAITIVSYTGITKKANESTVQAELSNAKKQISLYYAEHGVYPKTLGLNNCLSNDTVTPNPDTKYCLKSSGDSIFSLTDATGSDYTLTLTKGTDIAYKVTRDAGPTLTAVAAASFATTWGGTGGDYGYSVAQTGDGGYVITGQTTIYVANGNDMFIAKYDSSGGLLWNKTWGGTGSDVGYDIIKTNDGGYAVTGYTSFGAGSYDAFIAKYDTYGSLLWNKTWGGTGSEQGLDLVQVVDGGYVVTGSTTSYGAGNNDIFLVKFDLSGNLVWNRVLGASNADFNYAITQTNDGGCVVAGQTLNYGVGGADILLVKYDVNGNIVWNKTWGGASNDYAQDIILTADNGYAIVGYTASFALPSTDVFIVKFDNLGNLLWNKTWGSNSALDIGSSIAQSADGGYAVSGYTQGFGAGGDDIILIKYDSSGTMQWNRTWGGTNSDNSSIGHSLIKSTDGGYVLSANTQSYGAGSADALLLKFKIDGSINNCTFPMCQNPTATATTPSANITAPSVSTSTPTATITSPTATITTPTAIVTTVVVP